MSDIEIVPDEERLQSKGRPSRPMKPLHALLIDGKTVFVPLNGEEPFAIRNRAHSSVGRRGLRLHARRVERDGVLGLLMWADPKADR